MVYGAVSTALESVNFVKYADRILGPSIRKEVQSTWKKAVKETLVEGGIDLLKE